MVRIVAIARVLMTLLCLVPFSNARQASGAIAPCAPLAPVNETPPPVSEEDDERESVDGKERLVTQSRLRLPIRQQITLLPRGHTKLNSPSNSLTSPADADPFHNGLGAHYRC
jgi:hypothetical protein